MEEMDKVLYGDGATEVKAGPELVFFRQGSMLVVVSHAAMREIALSWERHELREKE